MIMMSPVNVRAAGVFHVQLYALFIGRVAAAFDLPQAGQARADSAIVAIELAILGNFVFDDRARTDQGHVAAKDIHSCGSSSIEVLRMKCPAA